VSFLVDRLTEVSPTVVYLTVALLVFGEAALFLGFVLPGETAVIIGGFLASRGHVNVVAMCAIVVVAAVVGDSVGYFVGERWGSRLLSSRLLRRRQASLARALAGLQRRGGTYVFLGRFTAFFRAVTPGLAGMSKLPYRRFLLANAAGGLLWGVGYTLLGYFAGNAYTRVEHYSTFAAIGFAALVVGLAVVLSIRGRRRERAEESAFLEGNGAATTTQTRATATTPTDGPVPGNGPATDDGDEPDPERSS
jgi:membrane-associated protein